MDNIIETINCLNEIKGYLGNGNTCFNALRRAAIDDAVSALENYDVAYHRGYIDGTEYTAKEYIAKIQKLIDEKISLERKLNEYEAEKDRLKKRLNDIYGTAGFKAAQVYDGRLERLEESVNDLKSKVNSISRDRLFRVLYNNTDLSIKEISHVMECLKAVEEENGIKED